MGIIVSGATHVVTMTVRYEDVGLHMKLASLKGLEYAKFLKYIQDRYQEGLGQVKVCLSLHSAY